MKTFKFYAEILRFLGHQNYSKEGLFLSLQDHFVLQPKHYHNQPDYFETIV